MEHPHNVSHLTQGMSLSLSSFSIYKDFYNLSPPWLFPNHSLPCSSRVYPTCYRANTALETLLMFSSFWNVHFPCFYMTSSLISFKSLLKSHFLVMSFLDILRLHPLFPIQHCLLFFPNLFFYLALLIT